MLQIRLNSVMVEDQTKALAFYTDILGFEKRLDFPVAGPYRWITVGAPGLPDVELALEPNENPAGNTFQKALFAQRIPATAFHSTDIEADYKRLTEKGVAFTAPPSAMGPVKQAVFSDTVGNLIMIYQPM
jgi:predicted enzyme related to lactoylglutathione lyase